MKLSHTKRMGYLLIGVGIMLAVAAMAWLPPTPLVGVPAALSSAASSHASPPVKLPTQPPAIVAVPPSRTAADHTPPARPASVVSWLQLQNLAARHGVASLLLDPQTGWITGTTRTGVPVAIQVPPEQMSAVVSVLSWDQVNWRFSAGLPIKPMVVSSHAGWVGPAGVMVGVAMVLVLLFMFWSQHRAQGSAKNFVDKMGTHDAAPGTPASRVRLADVAGCDNAKAEVAEVIAFLSDPSAFRRLGARLPAGLLLSGPPGTGKTLLAKAIACEAKVPFLSASSSSFNEMFVGVGSARMRSLFDRARQYGTCVVFLDEIDALGARRATAGPGDSGSRELDNTLNELLQQMDGFASTDGVVVVAATNRPDALDPALTRPGRFSRSIEMSLPDRAGRQAILEVHARTRPVHRDVDWPRAAALTIGFSGADLANLVNEAAIYAARRKGLWIDAADIEAARNRIIMGLPQSSMVDAEVRRTTAIHESGHAIAAAVQPRAPRVHAVTILPRSNAMGLTAFVQDREHEHWDAARVHAQLIVLLAGRAAEQMVVGTPSAGAANDLERATGLVRMAIAKWGLDPSWGASTLGTESTAEAESTLSRLDAHVRKWLERAEDDVRSLLLRHRSALDALTDRLVLEETVEGDVVTAILDQSKPMLPLETTANLAA